MKQLLHSSIFSVGFIGFGAEAESLAKYLITLKSIEISDCFAVDTNFLRGSYSVEIIKKGNINGKKECDELFRNCSVIVITKELSASEISKYNHFMKSKDKLLISLLPNYDIKTIRNDWKTDRAVRIMPNTPCGIGPEVTAIFALPGCTVTDMEVVTFMADSFGASYLAPATMSDIKSETRQRNLRVHVHIYFDRFLSLKKG